MAHLTELKTDRSVRSENAIAMLEGVIDRIRQDGVSHVSIFYTPLGPGSSFCDFFSDDIPSLVGALEIQKHDILAYRETGE